MILSILFWFCAFVIGWGMVGYKYSLIILDKIFKNRRNKNDYSYRPMVSVMIVAHNEEKVIREKLENVINNNYPEDKIEYIVASDNSTDNTNTIVKHFIEEHPEIKIYLHETKEHKGKTNAQNEAQKKTNGEILIMTDANSIFEENSISELVSSFNNSDVAYVSGRLQYINADKNTTASSESAYWERELKLREIESNISSITAGNGAIYACRNSEYFDFEPIKCHDSSMPIYFASQGKRAIYNPKAIAYEKAGENIADEFKRKVRMNREIVPMIQNGIKTLNIKKYGWFSYFYFGHRTCRYLLGISHVFLFLINFYLAFKSRFYQICFIMQSIFYILGILGNILKIRNKYISLIYYYCITIFAQLVAIKKYFKGESKAVWDKAESTR